jgi:biotin carboxylase
MRQKILLHLGGAPAQIPAIVYARSAGLRVVTCDYLPDNPGHAYADTSYNVSTTDQAAVLALARRLQIDGIVAYASDPSAPTAAWVSEQLGLPGAPVAAVRTLARKDLFRRFQHENGFFAPDYTVVAAEDDAGAACAAEGLSGRLVVKPVDSSGSKGVSLIDQPEQLGPAVQAARACSRLGSVIVERCVTSPYHQLHGDGFVVQGQLIFAGLCDHYFDHLAPVASVFPSSIDRDLHDLALHEVTRLLSLVGYNTGAVNIELRVLSDGRIFIVEIGPRSGGNYIPQLMMRATGFDEVAAVIDTAMGLPCRARMHHMQPHMMAILGARASGCFDQVALSPDLKGRVTDLYVHRRPGEPLRRYGSSADVVGVAIARYADRSQIDSLLQSFAACVNLQIKAEGHS